MWRETFRMLATMVFVLSLSASTVWAQFGGAAGEAEAGTVSGLGMVSVKQKPTLLRMTIQLQEKGKTVQESLAKLKDRHDAAVLQRSHGGIARDGYLSSDRQRDVPAGVKGGSCRAL